MFCEEHTGMIKENAKLASSVEALCGELKDIKERIIYHINEAEKPGGRHEQLIQNTSALKALQEQISVIKKGYWLSGVVGGLIGGLLGKISPGFFDSISHFLR